MTCTCGGPEEGDAAITHRTDGPCYLASDQKAIQRLRDAGRHTLADLADLAVMLRHKPFGMTHPTWKQPTNFFYETADEAQGAIVKAYGENSGHLVVGIIGSRP